jgi:hypothetical protein
MRPRPLLRGVTLQLISIPIAPSCSLRASSSNSRDEKVRYLSVKAHSMAANRHRSLHSARLGWDESVWRTGAAGSESARRAWRGGVAGETAMMQG